MKIEGVVICNNYADYLAWTLPFNRNVFDKLVVVTGEDDWWTANLCREYNVQCVKTNLFNNGKFPKGSAINLGLSHLSRTDWIIHWDADIYMTGRAREMLHIAKLHPENIYGALRMNCVGFENWIKFLQKPTFIHEREIYVHLGGFPMGALVSKTYTKDVDFPFDPGYLPIGYFQMWNESNGIHRVYPEKNQDAARSDSEFSLRNWPKRENRQLIPELPLIHLMNQEGLTQGANWQGRSTPRFDFKQTEPNI